jgi:hypothetical protein
MFPVIDYNIFFASSAQALSQTTITKCSSIGSCYTVSCLNGQPCQTFSSNQPSSVQPSQEVTTTTMQPVEVEETPIMQPVEEDNVMQPADVTTDQYIVVPVEFCGDGLDNDGDGKVDEDCGATTFSSSFPNDMIDKEDHMRQLPIDGVEQTSEEYEHSDDQSEGEEHED